MHILIYYEIHYVIIIFILRTFYRHIQRCVLGERNWPSPRIRMIIAGDVGAIICGKAKISLSPFRSRVNRYIIEQSPMHRFLRTCRNKGGTWPAKKKMMPPETQGLGAKRERGCFCRRIIALNLYLPYISGCHFRARNTLSLCGPINYDIISLFCSCSFISAKTHLKISTYGKECTRIYNISLSRFCF